jgi:hypothetical protein
MATKGDHRRATGGSSHRNPSGAIHALMREEAGSDGEDDRHGADHQRGVAHGGHGEPVELEQELQWHTQKGRRQQHTPFLRIQVGTMGDEQRRERHHGEEEPIQNHVSEVHLGESDLAEEEAATPERARQRAGCKS